MVGHTKEKAILSIINSKMSSETYREIEAVRLMNQGM